MWITILRSISWRWMPTINACDSVHASAMRPRTMERLSRSSRRMSRDSSRQKKAEKLPDGRLRKRCFRPYSPGPNRMPLQPGVTSAETCNGMRRFFNVHHLCLRETSYRNYPAGLGAPGFLSVHLSTNPKKQNARSSDRAFSLHRFIIQPTLFPQPARSNLLLHERGEQGVQVRRRVDRIRVHVRLVRAGHRIGLRRAEQRRAECARVRLAQLGCGGDHSGE